MTLHLNIRGELLDGLEQIQDTFGLHDIAQAVNFAITLAYKVSVPMRQGHGQVTVVHMKDGVDVSAHGYRQLIPLPQEVGMA